MRSARSLARAACIIRCCTSPSTNWKKFAVMVGLKADRHLFATLEDGALDQRWVLKQQADRLFGVDVLLLALRQLAPGRACLIEHFFPAELAYPSFDLSLAEPILTQIMELCLNPTASQPLTRRASGLAGGEAENSNGLVLCHDRSGLRDARRRLSRSAEFGQRPESALSRPASMSQAEPAAPGPTANASARILRPARSAPGRNAPRSLGCRRRASHAGYR